MRQTWLFVGVASLLALGAGCGSSSSNNGSKASGGSSGAGTGGSSGSGTGGSAGSGTGGSGTGGSAGSGTGGSGTGGSAGSGTGGSAGSGTGGSAGSGTGGSAGSGGSGGQTLSAKHPGDKGMAQDPDVVWVEDFEEGSVGAFTGRYDDHKNSAGMTLDPNVPAKSSGKASMKLTASGDGANATDFYKNLAPGYEELYVRYYAKYQANVAWHHTGVWVGGYNPASNWPNPQAGLKPNGDDRFSVSLEPMEQGQNVRMDFYNYWMQMHSWMAQPSGSTAYYGNSLVHLKSLQAPGDQWMCIELHIKLNPSGANGKGAELGLWVNDKSIVQFTDTKPLGYWIKDKFCPTNADSPECTNYPPPSGTTMIPLDLQYRSTTALKLNAFWPQNYITDAGASGSVWYDDMVVAKKRIGCLQ